MKLNQVDAFKAVRLVDKRKQRLTKPIGQAGSNENDGNDETHDQVTPSASIISIEPIHICLCDLGYSLTATRKNF